MVLLGPHDVSAWHRNAVHMLRVRCSQGCWVSEEVKLSIVVSAARADECWPDADGEGMVADPATDGADLEDCEAPEGSEGAKQLVVHVLHCPTFTWWLKDWLHPCFGIAIEELRTVSTRLVNTHEQVKIVCKAVPPKVSPAARCPGPLALLQMTVHMAAVLAHACPDWKIFRCHGLMGPSQLVRYLSARAAALQLVCTLCRAAAGGTTQVHVEWGTSRRHAAAGPSAAGRRCG